MNGQAGLIRGVASCEGGFEYTYNGKQLLVVFNFYFSNEIPIAIRLPGGCHAVCSNVTIHFCAN